MKHASTSPWHYKPWWCQPWSIVLTGISLIGGSWLLFHRYWFTALIGLPVLVWMGFFLLLWPRLMIESDMLDQEKLAQDKLAQDKLAQDKLAQDKLAQDKTL